MRGFVSIFLFLGVLLPIGALAAPIRIAYVGGLTGPLSQAAQKSLRAFKLLVKDYNKKGGIHHRQIEILSYDTQSSPAKNLTIIKEIKRDGPIAIVGIHESNDGLILARLAEENRIPLIVASATHPDITKNRKYVVRVCFTDDMQGKFLADFARNNLNAQTASIVVDVSNSFTEYLSRSFSTYFTKQGGKVLLTLPIRTNEKDFTGTVSELKKSGISDVLFIAASALESSYLISHLTRMGSKTPILGNDGWQNNDLGRVLKNLNQQSLQAYFSAHWHKDLPHLASKNFISQFESEYKEELSSFDADTVLTYDAAALLLVALSKAKSLTADDMMDSIRTTSISGVTGDISFSNSFDPKKPLHLLHISQGKVVGRDL